MLAEGEETALYSDELVRARSALFWLVARFSSRWMGTILLLWNRNRLVVEYFSRNSNSWDISNPSAPLHGFDEIPCRTRRTYSLKGNRLENRVDQTRELLI